MFGKILIIGIALGAVALCIILVSVGSSLGKTAPVSTAIPTATQTTGSTPLPETGIPEPGQAELVAYLEHLNEQLGLIVVHSEGLADSFDAMSNNSQVIFDDDWQLHFTANLTGLQIAGEGLQDRRPLPPGAQEVQRIAQSLGRELVLACDEYDRAVDEFDINLMERANDHMYGIIGQMYDLAQALENLDMD